MKAIRKVNLSQLNFRFRWRNFLLLTAGAVVSPDGRSVRISASPFFSYVPEFHTFNMFNGRTRRHPVQGYPGFGGPPPRRGGNNARVYHDGLRTRVEPRR